MGVKGRSRWLVRWVRRLAEDCLDAVRFRGVSARRFDVCGRSFLMSMDDCYSRRWCLRTSRNGYEMPATWLISDLLKDARLLVDVGANIGWHSALAASAGVDVVSFEMVSRFLPALRRNLDLNAAGGSSAVANIAVADTNGNARIGRFGSDRSSLFEEGSRRIETTTLDSYFGGKLPDGTVVKIDVEGAEAMVLHGMEKVLANSSVRVLVEVHPGRVDPFRFLHELSMFGEVFTLGHRGCTLPELSRSSRQNTEGDRNKALLLLS